jgi:hypothetical protein
LQTNEHDAIACNPIEKAIVIHGHPNGEPPGNKTQQADHDTQAITYVAGSIVETHFDLCRLTANRALDIHLHVFFEPDAHAVFK